jgi:CRISPR-associated protein Cas2
METSGYDRINQYRSMWVLVLFDLPTETKMERRVAARFRKSLLEDGFAMFQFSIYLRFCSSRENADLHIRRTKSMLPKKGKIGILAITDRQFGLMEIFHGKKEVPVDRPSQQLTLF